MCLLVGAEAPREFMPRVSAYLLALTAVGAFIGILIVTEAAMLAVSVEPQSHKPTSSTPCYS